MVAIMNYTNKALLLILLMMFPLALLALLNFSLYISTTDAFKMPDFDSFILFINLFLGIGAIISVFVVRNILKTLEEETRYREQVQAIRYLEEVIKAMRIQRHSFNHELQVVYGLIAVEAYAEAKAYLEKTRIKTALTNQLIKVNDPGLGALLMVKSSQMESQGIQFNLEIANSLEDLPLKTHDFSIILANLLDNAIEAIHTEPPPQPEISLEITKKYGIWYITVSNNGPAIKEETIDKLFQQGFSTKGEGRGMGLYIVKDLVEKNGGKIHVESNSEKTVFTIAFPD